MAWEQELQAPTTMQGSRKEYTKDNLLQQLPSAQDSQQCSQREVNNSHTPIYLSMSLITLPGLDALPPAGQIQHCMKNWQKLTSVPWVLEVVKGYPLEMELWPSQLVPPTPSMLNSKGQVLVQTEVEKMLLKRAICHVAPTKGQFRPVINLKGLNKFVTKSHFKMEGFHMLKDVLQRGDWMSSVDLKDAYFSVQIAQPSYEP